MKTTFPNAPLIEIIAELRWNFAGRTQPQPGAPVLVLDSTKLDEFFMRFGGEIFQNGFQKTERLVPSSFPMMLYQPVFRYTKVSDIDGTCLYQTGPGIFSANAIPPYKSWDDFSPVVKSGIEALLKSRDEAEKESPFTSISLRYIDAFNSSFMQDMDVETFLREIFGISVLLPEPISKVMAPNSKVKPHLQLQLPISDKTTMHLTFAEALVNNDLSIIMDSTVVTTGEVSSSIDVVMDALTKSRTIIHEMFVNLTAKIHPLMSSKTKA